MKLAWSGFGDNAEPILTFKSVKSVGGWFDQWYDLELELCGDVSFFRGKFLDNAYSGKVTLKELLESDANIHVYAYSTGWLCPSFLYMDTLPELVYVKNKTH